MRTEIFEIFKFSELSGRAKQRAMDHFRNSDIRSWDEALNSITKLTEHFDGEIADWNIDWTGGSYSRIKFEMPTMSGREIQRRLKELGKYNRKTGRGIGEQKLTGWHWDEDCIDGFRIAYRKGERNLENLMQAAFKSLLKSTEDEYESLFEDSEFSEFCDANDHEFYADGSLV